MDMCHIIRVDNIIQPWYAIFVGVGVYSDADALTNYGVIVKCALSILV
jgi:hypothetical protein